MSLLLIYLLLPLLHLCLPDVCAVGAVSPLNSGWYLAIPNADDFKALKDKAAWRLHCDWDKERGWADPIGEMALSYRGGKACERWDFNGADMDQGLLTHHFVMNRGGAMLVDTDLRVARRYTKGAKEAAATEVPMGDALACSGGVVPTAFFAHFTGQSKPWMVDKDKDKGGRKKGPPPNVVTWMKHLDALGLPINSSNVLQLNLGSPLGFFNSNFPKQNNPCFS